MERYSAMEGDTEMCCALSRQTAARFRYGSKVRIERGGYDWRQSALITSPRPPYSVDDYHQRTSEICVCSAWGLSHLGRNLSFLSLHIDLEWLCPLREGLKWLELLTLIRICFLLLCNTGAGLQEADWPETMWLMTFKIPFFYTNSQKFSHVKYQYYCITEELTNLKSMMQVRFFMKFILDLVHMTIWKVKAGFHVVKHMGKKCRGKTFSFGGKNKRLLFC